MHTLRRPLIAMLIAFLAVVYLVEAAQAQIVCGKRADIVAQLADNYGETQRSVKPSGGGNVVEFFASETTGTWTILLTSPQGITCMMAAGQTSRISPVKTSEKGA